ncbi:MAG TPA: hypothetical protein VJZ27_06770 [Aggregatilineales bacterium]|nr:hypothetical protein [Aggregatilineales bacterium]
MPFNHNQRYFTRSFWLSLPVFLMFMGIYLFSIGTGFDSSDAQVMYATGRALAFSGTVALQDDYGLPQIRLYPDGHYYSQYDPGMALLSAPVILVSDALAGWQLWNRYAFAAWMVRWISALAVAAGLAGLFKMALSIYENYRLALMIVLIAGLCTPVWVYARLYFTEGLLAGLLTLAFWNAYRRRGLWAGLWLGLAILTRAAMSIYLLPLVWLLWRNNLILTQRGGVRPYARTDGENAPCDDEKLPGRGEAHLARIKNKSDGSRIVFALIYGVIPFMIFPMVAAFGLLYHNQIRGGEAFSFGYGGQGFDTFLPTGIFGLLLSPGKGVFIYAPPLILSIFGWRRFWRRERPLAEAMLLAAGVALLFYGKWWAWHGGWCWGPRFLIPLLPLWILPAGEVLHGIRKSRVMQVTAGFLAVTGFALALIGVLTDVNLHYSRQIANWIEKHDYQPGDEIPDDTPRDVVNYSLALPMLDMLRFAVDGQYESPGILHLRSMGWQTAPAVIFPIFIVIIFGVNMVLMVRIDEQ